MEATGGPCYPRAMELKSFFDVVYIVCAAQGLFVVGLLWTRPQHAQANRFLAIAVLLISLSCGYMLYLRSGAFWRAPGWLGAIDTVPALYGPLFFLYTRALTGERIPGRRAWPHFVPFAAYTLYDVPRFLLSGEEKLALLRQEFGGQLRWDQWAWQWGVELQGLAYLILCLAVLRRFRSRIRGEYSSLERINLRWLQLLLVSLVVLWLGSIAGRLSPVPVLRFVHTGLTVIIFAIAYLNVAQPELFTEPVPVAQAVAVAPSSGAKYQKTRLKEEQAAEIEARIRELFEREKPYLTADFQLARLAGLLEVPPHHVSQVLNERFQKTFYDLVNSSRVEELKRRLLEPGLSADKILALGFDCGFSSKSALNSNFKKFTGMSPTEFREQHLQKVG
ncbi:helix-turn-helix domain-containing protein [Hyalangium versicolor]|uniref:helix-turn-helix domain-containing protein n=1 Tax=Hyalangium versicolor TaxID=2861190 RepID=UPI001CCA7669|nr:helix-turn-helix domain-containing protein [Hyalangium versicolor]